MKRWRHAISFVLVGCSWCPPFARAQSVPPVVQVEPIPRRPSAEFFSTRPGSPVLIGVNLWGELAQPGRHYLPVGSKLSDAVGASGGPNGLADTSSIRLIRKSDYDVVDLFKDGAAIDLKEGDSIYVPRSVKYDLPIYFGAASVLVSVMTLYYVKSKQ